MYKDGTASGRGVIYKDCGASAETKFFLPAKRKTSKEQGLIGMCPYYTRNVIGNVGEWTGSWYEPYPGSEYSAAEYGKKYRVIRGNSFSELGHFQGEVHDQVVAAQARATYRLFLPPNGAIEDLGFRCVKLMDH